MGSFWGESAPEPGFVRGDWIGDEVMDDEDDESAPRGGICGGILGEGPICCARCLGDRVTGSCDVKRTGGVTDALTAGDAVP